MQAENFEEVSSVSLKDQLVWMRPAGVPGYSCTPHQGTEQLYPAKEVGEVKGKDREASKGRKGK